MDYFNTIYHSFNITRRLILKPKSTDKKGIILRYNSNDRKKRINQRLIIIKTKDCTIIMQMNRCKEFKTK